MSDNIEHIIHENGINEIILHADDREVVDAYMGVVEGLVTAAIESEDSSTIHLLVNLTQTRNAPPFSYITKKGRNLLHEHFKDRKKFQLRSVLLARQDEMTIVSLAESFFRLLPVDAKMKAFESHQRDNAIAWLLSDE